MSNEQVYLYRRKGLSDYATCDRARYVELSQHKLFETMVCYASADADEVESWKETASTFEDFYRKTDKENEALRAQLAERDALLRSLHAAAKEYADQTPCETSKAADAVRRLRSALSASADPRGYVGPFPACPEGESVTALEWDIFYPAGISSAKPDQLVWIGMEDLPEHEVGARYRIILDDVQQTCTELKKEDGKRWFRGDDSGTFPIDEIQAWLPIDEPANQETSHEQS